MNITDKQKESFNRRFMEIVSASPIQVQELWQRIGKIYWPPNSNIPDTFGFETKFVEELANQYHILINEVYNRTIKED
ncbi:MAG: hypothetical protein EOO43_00670 [Flavobacterium sp.]|nr:MAG: hypothetical protein EOO43_00670 [Flavobacterium sp.]